MFEDVLQGQCVHDGGQHAHVVGLGPVEAVFGAGHTTPEVAASGDDGDFNPQVLPYVDDVVGHPIDDLVIDSESSVAGESLARQFEKDSIPAWR